MGREWNDKLQRRVQDSICRATDNPKPAKLLVTDLEDSDLTLVEVLEATVGPLTGDIHYKVVGEYLVRPKSRPKTLRYRAERGWPE